VDPARDDWLNLGTLTAPWGVRGEIKVQLVADPEFVGQVRRIYLGQQRQARDVSGFHRRGRAYTFKLRGVESANDAELLRGQQISIPRAEAPSLPAGEYFFQDIVGLRVLTTDGRDLGRVAQILATGANDVYVVRGDLGEILVPAIASVVTEIDITGGIIRITPMPGLLPDPA